MLEEKLVNYTGPEGAKLSYLELFGPNAERQYRFLAEFDREHALTVANALDRVPGVYYESRFGSGKTIAEIEGDVAPHQIMAVLNIFQSLGLPKSTIAALPAGLGLGTN